MTILKAQGYNFVHLPRSDLAPCQLLVRRGKRLRRLGELESIFKANLAAPAPSISADNRTAGIVGQRSAEMGIDIGLRILSGMISALGGSTLALGVGYKSARTMQFEFADVLENGTQITQLDQFLSGATISPFARAVREMLNSNSVYVLTSTLKSGRLAVAAKDANNIAFSVDVPALQQAIGGGVSVRTSGTGLDLVTYESATPLVFGFQAVRLAFHHGQYRLMKTVPSGEVSLERSQHSDEGMEGLYIAGEAKIQQDLRSL